MVLQHILWAGKGHTEITELYYHTKDPVKDSELGMGISAGAVVQFDTYFNAFLSASWKRYTTLEEVVFRIVVDGVGTIALMGAECVPLEVKRFCGEQEILFLAVLADSPYFYFVIWAERETVLRKGTIESVGRVGREGVFGKRIWMGIEEEAGSGESAEKNSRDRTVKLGLVLCTYKREKEIQRNMELIKRCNQEFEDGEAVLEQIFVVDNARSLKKSEIEGERISFIPNRNTGGSGGFSRGIQEAMKQEELTHIILMDDDVEIEFETFWRTKAVLSFIKAEYKEHFLGGAMFRRDIPYILHAAGEDWADGLIRNPYKYTDIREFQQVIAVAEPVETKQAYAGWWYCCIPRSHILKKGYPMPFFLHCDDVEYALRSGKPPIYLNGIAVWHEEFEDKRSSVMEYYDVRNRLITNAIYKEQGRLRDAVYILCERFYATVFRYRYKDFTLSVKAAQDFLKGPKWLKHVDAEALHKSLQRYGYQTKEVQDLLQRYRNETKGEPDLLRKKGSVKIGSSMAAIGRYFFPASGRIVLRMGAPVFAYSGKKKVLLVEPKSKKGMEVEKDWGETIRCLGQFGQICLKFLLRYRKAERMWRGKRGIGK